MNHPGSFLLLLRAGGVALASGIGFGWICARSFSTRLGLRFRLVCWPGVDVGQRAGLACGRSHPDDLASTALEGVLSCPSTNIETISTMAYCPTSG